ncbi:MAG TPA: fused MFS/spermidine synthase [Gemmatimonadales bacterium]|jgi:spermidine synthase
MSHPASTPAAGPAVPLRVLPILPLLFVGSGCAALIYEVVWFQLVQLVIGSSAVSLGVLLGTFMGGMCLGSLLLPRFISRQEHPLRIYAWLEGAIGVLGLLILFGLPALGNVYAMIPAGGLFGIILRGLFCAVCLLIPTVLMGATLPAVARWVEATPTGVSWLGFFYGSNIAGAVIGCVLAGFYLLRVYDMAVATYVACAINFAIAAAGLLLARRAPHHPVVEAPTEVAPTAGARSIYLAIALSGLTAIGAEVVWTRLLSLMLGATVYTFSLILAVVLIGLGIGSSTGAYMARVAHAPRRLLGWCQLLLPVTIAWTAYLIAQSLPYWPVNPSLSTDPWLTLQFDMMRCAFTILPATVLWGASFPLAIAAVARRGEDAGRLVGRVYAANTVGGIVGALLFSIIIIPTMGTQDAQRVMMLIAVVAALLVFLAPATELPAGVPASRRRLVPVGVLTVVSLLLVAGVHAVPAGLIGYGRFLATYSTLPKFLYVGEGMNSSIAVSELANGYRNFHVSGKVEASSEPQDMRLQRMLGDLSALVAGDPKTVLVVGFGAGVTAGSFVPFPNIKRIVICELEPLIPRSIGPYFSQQNYDVLHDPRVEIVYDDARHFILTTREKFDVITSDPIHPWVRGAATLYTKEYLDLAREHLNPGGVMTEWVPLYESHADAVKSEIATFLDAFPGGTVWANNEDGHGYDLVMLGQQDPTRIDVAAVSQRLTNPAYARVAASLDEVGIQSLTDLFGSYAGQRSDLEPWLHDAVINRDKDLKLQYIAGLENNSYDNAQILADFSQYRKFPEDLFVASDDWKNALSAAMSLPRH